MTTSNDIKWQKYGPVPGLRLGTTGVGVSAKHFTADGKNIVTELTLNTGAILPAVTGSIGVGLKIYTFPAGVHALKVARIAVAATAADGNNDADTPKVGLGDITATGAVTDLTGTAGFDNILTEQTADDCDGTVEDKTILVPTAGHLVNEAAGLKTVWLNYADAWAGAEAAMPLSGAVWLEWTRLSGV